MAASILIELSRVPGVSCSTLFRGTYSAYVTGKRDYVEVRRLPDGDWGWVWKNGEHEILDSGQTPDPDVLLARVARWASGK